VLLLFSADVTIDGGVFPDFAFTVNGVTLTSVSQLAPTLVRVQLFSSVFTGYPWSLSAQPNWLTTTVLSPTGGTVV